MKLSINLATRGRPELLIETIERTTANIRNSDTFFMVSADDDDEPTIGALNKTTDAGIFRRMRPVPWFNVRPREDSLGAKYNRILDTAPADVYLAMVDYAPHVTPGFDQKILDAAAQFPDGIGVVYNRMANLAFPGINAVTAGLVERMGFLYPPYWPVWFIDHWLDDIARMIGRIAYADIEIDTSRRPGTQNLRDLPFWAELYNRLAPTREECASKILNSVGFFEPYWRRELLKQRIPLTRQRSEIINAIAVQQNAHGAFIEDNERHQRLRAQAQQMVRDLGQEQIPEAPTTPQRHPCGTVFATPNLDHWVCQEFEESWSQTMFALSEMGYPFQRSTLGGDPFVDKARSKLATVFLTKYPEADNFFFLDADIGWPAHKIIEFIQRPEPVVAGIYQKKQAETDFPVDLETDADGNLVERDGLLKACMVPTGFMRIKRWALERLAEKYPTFGERELDGVTKWNAIFQHGIGPNGFWWGEDAAFCERCTAAGIEIWVDPDVELTHRGEYVWRAKLSDYLDTFRKVAKGELESNA